MYINDGHFLDVIEVQYINIA